MECLHAFLCLGFMILWNVSPAKLEYCYDRHSHAQMCHPPYENVAYGKVLEATNTCGVTSEVEYCSAFDKNKCDVCNDKDGSKHPTTHMTDDSIVNHLTWWQSETMLEGVQSVNLTLHLKKSFAITFIRCMFASSRPESFAIFKKTQEHSPWTPYQFYSASCHETYALQQNVFTTGMEAVCTSRYSDITPGIVHFSTLKNRFFSGSMNPKLRELVTATDIRLVLTRMNTFGDEVFGGEDVLKSYFYAISDLRIGGRCQCYGHAKACHTVADENQVERLVCACEHHTTGTDCEQCMPLFNDQPWRPATATDAHECKACNCSGLSTQCIFDPELYRQTGHGGRCLNCREHSVGRHCEMCEKNYYRADNQCRECQCDPTGSLSGQCEDDGRCQCKPGVGGFKCDTCTAAHFGFGPLGCSPCQCVSAGTLNNDPQCEETTGTCICKKNVVGHRCNLCKPRFYRLSENDPFGCMACFCYGHSSSCTSATGYYEQNMTTRFREGKQGWADVTVKTKGCTNAENSISPFQREVYINAPDRYLGDQRFSYNQLLTFDVYIGDNATWPSDVEVLLEGSGEAAVRSKVAQFNPVPGEEVMSLAFRLHEDSRYKWEPSVTASGFLAVLSNLTTLKITLNYCSKDAVGSIDNIRLMSASPDFGEYPVNWVESCACPDGYTGQFCESCHHGYTRTPPQGGPSAQCVPCRCNSHSKNCDVNTGRCVQCQNNTEGDNCERCIRGYYGDATVGTREDCTLCPCFGGGPCKQTANGKLVCLESQRFAEAHRLKERVVSLEESMASMEVKYNQLQVKTDQRLKLLETRFDSFVETSIMKYATKKELADAMTNV